MWSLFVLGKIYNKLVPNVKKTFSTSSVATCYYNDNICVGI